MTRNNKSSMRRNAILAVMLGGSLFALPSCKGVFTTIDLCGTVLGNCEPGDFKLLFAEPGTKDAYDVDPFCTIPGGCDDSADPRPDFSDPFGQLGPQAKP